MTYLALALAAVLARLLWATAKKDRERLRPRVNAPAPIRLAAERIGREMDHQHDNMGLTHEQVVAVLEYGVRTGNLTINPDPDE